MMLPLPDWAKELEVVHENGWGVYSSAANPASAVLRT